MEGVVMRFFLLFVFFISCLKNVPINSYAPEAPKPHEMLETVSFEQVQKEVFIPKCISCHGNQGGVNLESHASAHHHMEAIRESTLQSKVMPKSPISPLNDRQYEVITAWIDAGGPDEPAGNNPSDEETPSTPTGNGVSFKEIKKQILDLKCLTCHRVGEHAGNIPLETREQLLSSSIGLLIPGKPMESKIYTITVPGVMNMMPPYPDTPLTNAQRKMLKEWIKNGAL